MSSSNWCRSVYTSSAPDLQESKQGENCPFNYTMLFAISFFIPLHSIELVSLISTPLFVLSFSAWLQQQSFCTSTAAIQIPRGCAFSFYQFIGVTFFMLGVRFIFMLAKAKKKPNIPLTSCCQRWSSPHAAPPTSWYGRSTSGP